MPSELRQILSSAKNIAVVGLSPDESKPSNEVAKFLIESGFNVFPVYPKFDEILELKVYRNLTQIDENIDISVMFRKGEFASELVKDAVKKGVKTLWLQLGITNDEAGAVARENGINFVQDKCIKIELERLDLG
ncbi:CoA-binding protein [Campylobacter sp. Marseille-Q3452]|uniref:CoA-binding protein n=1 Tax=Campylobacter massiliensis TaxID=2762557 RepID=A0A842JEE9_9BACT|nr:CoA-binding protein [Campylobacter massiliensis]MBC2883414.1 CoA-binding protein [Campylobacter massiliensis]